MTKNFIRLPLAALALCAASVTVQAQETAAAPAYTILSLIHI